MGDICEVRTDVDTAWLISNAIIVLTMQGGFALVESGSVRYLNATNVLFKNFVDLIVGGVGYYMIGWALAYGKDWKGFMGTTQFFPDAGEIDAAMWFFQFSFAATTSTIDSGAVVERMRISVYIGLSFLMTVLTYPVVSHWVWASEGFLNNMGFIDFAGTSVVHTLGGASALVCCYFLGPRLGVFGTTVPKESGFTDADVALSFTVFKGDEVHVLFGTLLLMFGWFGFNCGSTLGMSGRSHIVASHVAFTTTLGASFGGFTACIISVIKKKHIDPTMCSIGLLSGLVGVTGAAHLLTSVGAAIAGTLAAIIALGSIKVFEKFKIDDPVGVLAVHWVAGNFGTLVPALLTAPTKCGATMDDPGLFYGGGIKQLGIQMLGLLVINTWGIGITALYYKFVQKVLHLDPRVSAFQEIIGNDIVEHGIDNLKRIKDTKDFQRTLENLSPEHIVALQRVKTAANFKVSPSPM